MAGKISQSGDFIIMNKLSPCLNTCAIIDNWQPKLSLENYCNFAIFNNNNELPRILTLQYSYFLTYFAKRIFLMIHGSRIIINVSFKVL